MPLTEDFTYRLGDDGVILNPDSTSLPFVDIEKVAGLDNAEYRSTQRQHEGTDGSFMDAEFEHGRSIILDGTLYADHEEVEPYLDSLKANYAPSRNLIPFYFKKPGVQERFAKVKPLGCKFDVEQLRRIGQTNIQFSMFAEDPRFYSTSLNEVTIVQSQTALTGRGYNKGYDYGYGDPVDPSAQNVFVGGNRPTPVVFTIYGPAVDPTIISENHGISMKFAMSLEVTDVLVVDTYYHTVRLNGTNRRSALLEPNWFMLTPGNNVIRYLSQIDGNSVLVVTCHDAWR